MTATDTGLDALIETASTALTAAAERTEGATEASACIEDEAECFRIRPVHFAWYQLGETGVVGETKAIARVVIEAVHKPLLDELAKTRRELDGLRGDLNDVMAQRDKALTDGTKLIVQRDAAREELAKTRAELDTMTERRNEVRELAAKREAELIYLRAELKRAQRLEAMAGRHAQARDADLNDAEVTIARLKARLAEGDARWSRHMTDEHPIQSDGDCPGRAEKGYFCTLDPGHEGDHVAMALPKDGGEEYEATRWPQEANPATTAEPADEPKTELCSDKNGFHDGHDWTPDPCEPHRWCPGYPVPAAS